MLLETRCPICGGINYITIKAEDYQKYKKGALVQDAFPYLSAEERELILSGTCSRCWDKCFGEDSPEEEKMDIRFLDDDYDGK